MQVRAYYRRDGEPGVTLEVDFDTLWQGAEALGIDGSDLLDTIEKGATAEATFEIAETYDVYTTRGTPVQRGLGLPEAARLLGVDPQQVVRDTAKWGVSEGGGAVAYRSWNHKHDEHTFA